jgi:CheY-like chemotaxis protein
MPRMDGMELIRHLRKSQNAPPVIAVTGDARIAPESIQAFAQSLGAKAILLKPFSREQLANALVFALAKPERKASESKS